MSYAIVQTGGKQYRVEPGRFYDVERLPAEVGSQLDLSDVVLVNLDGDIHVGQPFVAGSQVKVKVLEHRKAKKIVVYKMRPKKKTRRKNGHRQQQTRILVESIGVGSKTAGQVSDTAIATPAVEASAAPEAE